MYYIQNVDDCVCGCGLRVEKWLSVCVRVKIHFCPQPKFTCTNRTSAFAVVLLCSHITTPPPFFLKVNQSEQLSPFSLLYIFLLSDLTLAVLSVSFLPFLPRVAVLSASLCGVTASSTKIIATPAEYCSCPKWQFSHFKVFPPGVKCIGCLDMTI